MTYDIELLVLERGQGKSTALIESIHAYDGPWPEGRVQGVVVVPAFDRVASVCRAAHQVAGPFERTGRTDVAINGNVIRFVFPRLLDAARGMDRDTPVWVDDCQDFDGPILEMIPEWTGLTNIVMATMTTLRRPPIEPARGYNPRLVRHSLDRVPRPLPILRGPDGNLVTRRANRLSGYMHGGAK